MQIGRKSPYVVQLFCHTNILNVVSAYHQQYLHMKLSENMKSKTNWRVFLNHIFHSRIVTKAEVTFGKCPWNVVEISVLDNADIKFIRGLSRIEINFNKIMGAVSIYS